VSALPALGACLAPGEASASADHEVYGILAERPDEFPEAASFRVEAPADSLRGRILAGEAASDPANPLVVDLVDCLEIAAENSRDYQDRREALYRVGLDLTLERYRFSVQEAGVLGAFLDGSFAEGSGFDGESAGASSFLGLTKLFAIGTRFVSNIGLDLVHDIGQGNGWDAVGNFSVNVTQPLMRGFGADVVREPLTQAERDVLYELRNYERFRQTLAFDVASRYYRVLQQFDTMENEERNLERLRILRERNEALAEAGRLSDIQVDQARQDELRAETRLVDARRDLASSLDGFKLFLGLPIEARLELDRGTLEGLESRAVESVVGLPVEDRAHDLALRERFDYQVTRDRREDAERRLHVAADALRMGLDLSASAAGVSDPGQPFDFDDGGNWQLAVSADLPIDRLPERNAYRSAELAVQAARRDAEEASDRIRLELRDDMRVLSAAGENYDIQRGAVTLAERRVESAQLNFEAGRASTRDLLEAQEDLVQARNAATAALIDFTIARLALRLDLGTLRFDQNGFDLSELDLASVPETEP